MSKWSEAELEMLRDAYSHKYGCDIRLDDLAKRLGRHKTNVSRKARELGLTAIDRPKVFKRPVQMALASVSYSNAARDRIKQNGHPKGFKGKAHVAESRAVMGQKAREAWADPTSAFHREEYRQKKSDIILARAVAGIRTRTYSRAKSGRRADLADRYFRSRWEANYARYLNLLVSQGKIESWDYECKTFVFEKIKRGTRCYTPDFKVVMLDGAHEWHEVKGWMDQPSRTRIERFRRYYPAETLRIIDQQWFTRARKSGLAGSIACWEYES